MIPGVGGSSPLYHPIIIVLLLRISIPNKMILLTTRFYIVAAVFLFICSNTTCNVAARTPNVVIIFADDMGYGDMSSNGHPTIRTPHLDRIAYEGQKWSNFYAAASVCTPSRAGLLTGRYPIRNGMCSAVHQVLFPESTGGLPSSEITIADLLNAAGYSTAMVGKWHLGHLPEFLPAKHGFDEWFGIPYSNDMDLDRPTVTALNDGKLGLWHTGKHWDEPMSEYWGVPLMQGDKIIKRSPDQSLLTQMYTKRSIDFIKKNADKPFFLYIAHSMPHVPLFRSENFVGTSTAGIYGDVIEEIDWSVGQIIETLDSLEISEHTLVIFTSDNGPWLQFRTQGGSAGLLRGGKGTTWEGGMRVPAIFWWPESIEPKIVHGIGSTIDLMATICSLANVDLPKKIEDSLDLSNTLLLGQESQRNEMIYYRRQTIEAIRLGAFKGHFDRKASGRDEIKLKAIYNLDMDPAEAFNLRDRYPDIAEALCSRYQEHKSSIIPVVDQLARRK